MQDTLLDLFCFLQSPTDSPISPEGWKGIAALNNLPDLAQSAFDNQYKDNVVLRNYRNMQRGEESIVSFERLTNPQAYKNYSDFLRRMASRSQEVIYPALINQLVSEEFPCAQPIIAYQEVMQAWRDVSPDDAARYDAQDSVQNWLQSQLAPGSQGSNDLVELYHTAISSCLTDSETPFGVIPLVLSAWQRKPEAMVAYVRWLLEQGETPETIISSQLLQAFFLQHADDIGNESGCFQRFYAIMQQRDDTRTVYEVAQTVRVNFVRGLTNDSLTGAKLPHMDIPIQPIAQCLLLLPYEHDSEAYFRLFGQAYLVALIAEGKENNKAWLSEKLNALSSSELIHCLNAIEELSYVASLLSGSTIERLLEQRQPMVCRFMTKENTAFLRKIAPEEQERLLLFLTATPLSLRDALGLRRLYDQVESTPAIQQRVFESILNTYLSVSYDDELVAKFLKAHQASHPDVVARASAAISRPLEDLFQEAVNSGFTEFYIHGLQDAWSAALPKFNRLKALYPSVSGMMDFPKDKYLLYQRIIEMAYTNSGGQLNPEAILGMLYGESFNDKSHGSYSEVLRLLVLVMSSTTDKDLRVMIQALPIVQATDWVALRDQGGYLYDITCEYGAYDVYAELAGHEPSQAWMEQALQYAARQGQATGVQALASLAGENRLSRLVVEKALKAAARDGCVEAIQAIISLTSDNKSSQKGIDGALKGAAYYGHVAVVQEMLSWTGDHKPSQAGIDGALLHAARQDHAAVVQMMASLTGENKPSQAGIDDVLLWAADQSAVGVVQTIIVSLMSDNEVSRTEMNEALRTAAAQGNVALVQTIVSLMVGSEPSQTKVDNALKWAAYQGQMALAQAILSLTGDNKPSQVGIDTALINASYQGHMALAQTILSLTGDNKPSQVGIDTALIEALRQGHLVLVQAIVSLSGDNKPSQVGIDDALIGAAQQGHVEVVQTIVSLAGDNKPSQEGVDNALKEAAKHGHVEVVQTIVSLAGDNKPSLTGVDDAQSMAAHKGHETIAQLLSVYMVKQELEDYIGPSSSTTQGYGRKMSFWGLFSSRVGPARADLDAARWLLLVIKQEQPYSRGAHGQHLGSLRQGLLGDICSKQQTKDIFTQITSEDLLYPDFSTFQPPSSGAGG